MDDTIILAEFKKSKFVTTEKQWQYNRGQKLVFTGIDLPPHYQVHFSNSKTSTAKTVLGDENGVLIPQEYFIPGSYIYAWIHVQDENSGVTIREVTIPIHPKAKPIDQEPTPDQETVIDQAIDELNNAAQVLQEATDDLNDRIDTALQEAKDSGEFDGTDGSTMWMSTRDPISPNYTFYKNGLSGTPGAKQKENDFIFFGEKLYRIIQVYDFTVLAEFYLNLKGKDGQDGFSPRVSIGFEDGDFQGRVELNVTDKDGLHAYPINNVGVFNFYVDGELNLREAPGVVKIMGAINDGCWPVARITPTTGAFAITSWMINCPCTYADVSNITQPVIEFRGTDPGNSSIIWILSVDENDHDRWVLNTADSFADLNEAIDDLYETAVLKENGEVPEDLAMGGHKITNLEDGVDSSDAATVGQTLEMIRTNTGMFRGNYARKSDLTILPWQHTNPDAQYYVDDLDFAVVQADESKSDECWRYSYTKVNGWRPQYRVNETPLSSTQLAALNSGITAARVNSYNQNVSNVGTLSNLQTTNKENLVAAINEVRQQSIRPEPEDEYLVVDFVFSTDDTPVFISGPHLDDILEKQPKVLARVFFGSSENAENIVIPFSGLVDEYHVEFSGTAAGMEFVLSNEILQSGDATWDLRIIQIEATDTVSEGNNNPVTSDAVYQALAGKLNTTGNAYRAVSIPMGHLDSTSTATVMTATVDGITELRDGVCVWLENGVIASASGVTLNINSLGAKPIYNSLSGAVVTTTFTAASTYLFVYNSTRVTGGCWDMVYGYDANTTYTPVKLGFGYAICSTAEAIVSKTAALSSYTLTTGGIVAVKFTNAVHAGATLNINSKGAKAIYYHGAAITAGVIKAGDTVTMIYSTHYHVLSIDRENVSAFTNDAGYLTETTIAASADNWLGDALAGIDAENIPVFLYDRANGVYIPYSPQDLAAAYRSQSKILFALVVPPNYNSYPVLFTVSKFDTTTGELHLTGITGGVLYEATLLPGADPTGESAGVFMVGTMTTTNLALPSAQGVSF